ncbi:MAG: hypothetical protein WBH47_02455 [Streptosporangiaceae bacterium]
MPQYLLAPYCESAVPIPPEQTQQVLGDGSALGDRLPDAGAFVSKTGLLPAELATGARLTREQTS